MATIKELPLPSYEQMGDLVAASRAIALGIKELAAGSAPGVTNPVTWKELKEFIDLGLGPVVTPIGSVIPVYKASSVTASMGVHTGITAVTVAMDVFLAAIGEVSNAVYEFKHDGTSWHLEEHAVNPTNYGITVTGTPADGDTFTVTVVAAVNNFVVVDTLTDGKLSSGDTAAIKFKDPFKKNGIILHAVDVDYYGICFDEPEALYCSDSALPAGTYYFSKGSYDSAYASENFYQFTATAEIPANAQVVLEWGYQRQITEGSIKIYADGNSRSPLATYAISAGNSGTYLGDANASTRSGDINHIQVARYGYNRYSQSFIRQNLNSAAAKGNYYAPASKFDRKPAVADTLDGYMKGFDPGFLDIVEEVIVETCKNTITDCTSSEASAGNAYDETVDKFFLPSRAEMFGGRENASEKNTPFAYYKANSDLSTAGTGEDKNRIKLQGSTARVYWLRSPYAGGAGNPRSVNTSGTVGYGSAGSGNGWASACVI